MTIVLENLCRRMHEVCMSGKAFLTCWRTDFGDMVSLKNLLVHESKFQEAFCKLWLLFFACLFARSSWYLQQMLESLNTWFSNIQTNYIWKISISSLKYSFWNKVKHNMPTLHCKDAIFFMTAPTWNIIHFTNVLAVRQ